MLEIIPGAEFRREISVAGTRAVTADTPPYLVNWPLIVETFTGIHSVRKGIRRTIGTHCSMSKVVFVIINTSPGHNLLARIHEEIRHSRGIIGHDPLTVSLSYSEAARTFVHIADTVRGIAMGTSQQIFVTDATIEGLNTVLSGARKDAIVWIRITGMIPAAELSLLGLIMSMTRPYWVECVNDLWLVCVDFEKTLTKGLIRKLALGYSRPIAVPDTTVIDDITGACREFYSARLEFNSLYRTMYSWPDVHANND